MTISCTTSGLTSPPAVEAGDANASMCEPKQAKHHLNIIQSDLTRTKIARDVDIQGAVAPVGNDVHKEAHDVFSAHPAVGYALHP